METVTGRDITKEYLEANPNHVFVFGDNLLRKGKKGAAFLRDEPNVYGFITKKRPSLLPNAFYRSIEYKDVFEKELSLLMTEIESNPDKTYLISRLGGGLANKFHIWQRVIRDGLKVLQKYPNVVFLYVTGTQVVEEDPHVIVERVEEEQQMKPVEEVKKKRKYTKRKKKTTDGEEVVEEPKKKRKYTKKKKKTETE